MPVWYQLWVPALTFAVLVGALLCLRNLTLSKGFSRGLRLPRLLVKEEQLPRVTRDPPSSEAEFEVAPCSRVHVEWRGVSLTVDCNNRILINCSGSAQPSHITAIIGYASEPTLRDLSWAGLTQLSLWRQSAAKKCQHQV